LIWLRIGADGGELGIAVVYLRVPENAGKFFSG